MADERKGFDLEVLGPALQERAGRGREYIDVPLSIQAKLFAIVAREVIERWGDEGRDAIVEAVKRFGVERGRRMAERAASEGRQPDFASFLVFSDLDTSHHQMAPDIAEGEVRVIISYCPFAAACREWGPEEYGKPFCRDIDAAITRGYNPGRYETVCERNLTEGADARVIVYRVRSCVLHATRLRKPASSCSFMSKISRPAKYKT